MLSSLTASLVFLLFISTAISAAEVVSHLPGFNGPLPFHMETGYITVEDVEFFYYFIHSEGNPKEDPLIFWLNGGPRSAALSAILFDVGPLRIVNSKYDGSIPSLIYNPYSWTKVGSVLFVDYPVGSGFSYSRSPEAYDVGDVTSSTSVYKFFIEWFNGHPEFLSNALYVTGDSYGGKIVPLVMDKISEGNGIHHFYNLKGYAIGSPATGELVDKNSRVLYANGVGIISDELMMEIEGHCQGEDYTEPSPHRTRCYNALRKFNDFYSELFFQYILEPKCNYALIEPVNLNATRSLWRRKDAEFLPPSPGSQCYCTDYAYYLGYLWANNNLTREALHVKKDTVKEWIRLNHKIPYTMDIPSTVKYHKDLTTRGYRALVYSGDQDLHLPHVGTQSWIRSLNYSIAEEWRSWHIDGQVAGYTRKYINDLTFATIKNAGHSAGLNQPKNCMVMLKRWIDGQSQ